MLLERKTRQYVVLLYHLLGISCIENNTKLLFEKRTKSSHFLRVYIPSKDKQKISFVVTNIGDKSNAKPQKLLRFNPFQHVIF